MAATCNLKICTGTDAGTENAGDATNWNLMSTDEYDSTGTTYQTAKISVPSAGTTYSYERWMRLEFTGTFNLIENVKAWHSSGTLSDAALGLYAGETDTGATPVNTESSIATTALSGWDSEGEAIDITPSVAIETSGDKTDYLVSQLRVPYTVVTPGDIGTQTLTFSYDES
jgi:hypothetical protein